MNVSKCQGLFKKVFDVSGQLKSHKYFEISLANIAEIATFMAMMTNMTTSEDIFQYFVVATFMFKI